MRRRDRRSSGARTPRRPRRTAARCRSAPFQLCASRSRKISNAARAPSGARSFATSTAPSARQAGSSPAAASCPWSRSACARSSPPRNGRARSESLSIWPWRAPSAAIIARQARASPSSSLSSITFGSVARLRDRIEERRHHGVGMPRIDHRARDECILIGRRREELRKQRRDAPLAQRPQPDQCARPPRRAAHGSGKPRRGRRAERRRMHEHVRRRRAAPARPNAGRAPDRARECRLISSDFLSFAALRIVARRRCRSVKRVAYSAAQFLSKINASKRIHDRWHSRKRP